MKYEVWRMAREKLKEKPRQRQQRTKRLPALVLVSPPPPPPAAGFGFAPRPWPLARSVLHPPYFLKDFQTKPALGALCPQATGEGRRATKAIASTWTCGEMSTYPRKIHWKGGPR
jgi:hypothetical protein